MKLPGPDHPITIVPATRRVRAKVDDHVIADTAHALMLTEAGAAPVAYLPREDVEMGFLSKTDRHTYCPYKGEASYYSLHMDGQMRENCVWSYEDPYPAMQEIKGMLAFYPNQVEVYTVEPDV
jgi:uncharacterized protein (DUF427 family)